MHLSYKKKQRGVVLIVTLCCLLILTILGVSAMTSSTFNEKMTSNVLQRNISFQSADTALRDGENWLQTQAAAPTAVSVCATPPCRVWQSGVLPNLATQTTAWWQTNGTQFSSSLGSGVANNPVYIIQYLFFVADDLNPINTVNQSGTYYYTVTAQGVGPTTDSQAVVQSVYAIRFN